jgi:dipeptidyl aminopeptidase/acylaminoacyl peptidase
MINRMPATGAQDPISIFPAANNIYPLQWSSDGKILMYGESNDQEKADIKFHFTDGATEDLLLKPNRASETLARFSPAGDYVAYTSSESGTYEVYVQPFPPTGDRWVVSSGGGEEPVWAPDGKKLYYRNRDIWMEVKIITHPVFTVKERKELFSGPYNNVPGYSYDITPDGQSLVLLKPVTPENTTTRIKVIKNWFQQVKRLAPVDKN